MHSNRAKLSPVRSVCWKSSRMSWSVWACSQDCGTSGVRFNSWFQTALWIRLVMSVPGSVWLNFLLFPQTPSALIIGWRAWWGFIELCWDHFIGNGWCHSPKIKTKRRKKSVEISRNHGPKETCTHGNLLWDQMTSIKSNLFCYIINHQ